ncbi:MAG: DUF599 family protein [Methyloceanibacter sp.]|nr:DUF599 family protein [Methyloceanibacter sp.]
MSLLDILAFAWFCLCFFGYAWAVRYGPLKSRRGLVAAVNDRRLQWMETALKRDVRIMDSQLLMSLSSGNAFFASTSVLVLGGLTAMLGAADNVKDRLEQLPFVAEAPLVMWEVKILFLMILMIMAFFAFAWAFRLTHYVGTMFGALPLQGEAGSDKAQIHARKTAQLVSVSGRHLNAGLRTIYFAIAGLAWFVSPILFVIACTLVTAIVYRREYRSEAFAILDT